jgi:hypothetical protein
MRPVARRSGLVVRELPDETLVYDTESHQAHCLNRVAGLVFRSADGTRSLDDLARLVGQGQASEELVRGALLDLAAAGLLVGPPQDRAASGLPRREVMRRVGLGAAVLVPAVVSILAPTPAEAAATCVCNCSGQPANTPCTGAFLSTCTDTCDGSGNCSDGLPPTC